MRSETDIEIEGKVQRKLLRKKITKKQKTAKCHEIKMKT